MLRVEEIEEFLKKERIFYTIQGNRQIQVDGYSPLDKVSENKITWVKEWTSEVKEQISRLQDLIVVCGENNGVCVEENCYIFCKDPKMCFFEILCKFYTDNEKREEIARTAIVETKRIGEGSVVGEFSYIGKDVELLEGVQIGNHVTITGKVRIGYNSVIASGAVLGKAGYGYYVAADGHRKRVPHLGGIIIGDFVEVGANTCIDCGTMGDTVIGNYTKIDSLCHIGHNVQIGEDVMIVAGSVLCGSCRIAEGSYIAPGAVIKNQVRVEKNAFIGIQTAVVKDVKESDNIFGVPGRAFKREYKI